MVDNPEKRRSQGVPVFLVTSGKGGVGKTSVAIGLAYLLSRQYKLKVLLVDLDLFSKGLTFSLFKSLNLLLKLDQICIDRIFTRNPQDAVTQLMSNLSTKKSRRYKINCLAKGSCSFLLPFLGFQK